MSEYCERCVHTDAEIARLTKERDEAKLRLRFLEDVEKDLRKLAIEVGYPEPQHGKGRHGLDCTTLLHSEFVSLRAQVARLQAEGAAMREALVSIEEYWNRNPNERAMQDACDHAIETARRALNNLPERNDGE